MKFQTHILGGIALGICTSSFFNYPIDGTIIYYSSIMLGALLPDLDHPKSFLGKKIKPISKLFYKMIGHRTLTHSLWVIVITLELCRLNDYPSFLVGLTLGIGSHILLDLLTPQGIALLYPISRKRYKFYI